MAVKGISSSTVSRMALFTACAWLGLNPTASNGQTPSEMNNAYPSGASQNVEPVIIKPVAPTTAYTIEAGDTDNGYATKLGPLFSQTIASLQSNMLALHELNNASNQRILNEFGKNYGSVDRLGDHFAETITGMDFSLLKQDTDALSSNVNSFVSDYNDATSHFSENLGSNVMSLTQGLDMKSFGPNPDAQTVESSPAVADLRNKAKSSVSNSMNSLKSMIGQFKQVVNLNDALGTLNSNLESVVKSYNQMLTLSARRPSELTAMSGLAAQVGKMDNLARSQLKLMDSLHDELTLVNGKYEALSKAGGISAISKPDSASQAGEALAQSTAAITAFASHIKGANQQMSIFLGAAPSPTLATGANGLSIPPMSDAMRSVVQGAQIAPPADAGAIPQIDPAQIPVPSVALPPSPPSPPPSPVQ